MCLCVCERERARERERERDDSDKSVGSRKCGLRIKRLSSVSTGLEAVDIEEKQRREVDSSVKKAAPHRVQGHLAHDKQPAPLGPP